MEQLTYYDYAVKFPITLYPTDLPPAHGRTRYRRYIETDRPLIHIKANDIKFVICINMPKVWNPMDRIKLIINCHNGSSHSGFAHIDAHDLVPWQYQPNSSQI